MKTIGLYGVEKQDIIMVLARTLHRMGNKVLVLDATPDSEVLCILPTDQNRRNENQPTEYRGIYFMSSRKIEEEKLNDILRFGEYDVLLIDLGFQVENPFENLIMRRIYICDQQKHHVLRLCDLAEKQTQTGLFLFRDIYSCKLTPLRLLKSYGFEINKEQLYVSYAEESDGKYRVLSQYDVESYFSKLSRTIQDFSVIILQMLHPELTDSSTRRICKKAEKEDRKK